MKEVAGTRTNRSEIILVSITRKSLTGSPGLEREGAPLKRQSKESSQRPPSPLLNMMRKASGCVAWNAEKNGASSLVMYWCTPRKIALHWGNKSEARRNRTAPAELAEVECHGQDLDLQWWKPFTADQNDNRRDRICFLDCIEKVPAVMRGKHAAGVMF